MTENNICVSDLCSTAKRNICSNRILHACRDLEQALLQKAVPEASERLRDLKRNYNLMLQYALSGGADPERDRLFANIKADFLEVADMILWAHEKDSLSLRAREESRFKAGSKSIKGYIEDFKAQAAILTLAKEAGAGADDARIAAENDIAMIFSGAFSCFPISNSHAKELQSVIVSEEGDQRIKLQLLAGLTLAGLKYFDARAFGILIEAASLENTDVSARALTGILLLISRHGEIVDMRPDIKSRLELMMEKDGMSGRIRDIAMNMLRTFDTDRVSDKMKREVLPELMKIRPSILKRLKNPEDIAEMSELNPEWEQLMKETGMEDKMRELSELQENGADMMMTAFANLKQFRFFHTPANWFLPFDPDHSEVARVIPETVKPFVEMIVSRPEMCDNDKYSLALSMAGMPENMRASLGGQLKEQMDSIKEEMNAELSPRTFSTSTLCYLRDLYRFFRLNQESDKTVDPFSAPATFSIVPEALKVTLNEDLLSLFAEFLFSNGYYAEAAGFYERLAVLRPAAESADLEKEGYCREKLGDIDSAIDCYMKAELMNPDSAWLIRRLAVLYRAKGDYAKASEYFEKDIEIKPRWISLMRLGHCLIEMGKVSEAKQRYFEADFRAGGNNADIKRAIAWCELLEGDVKSARCRYDELIMTEAAGIDYLNAGHVALIEGRINDAYTFYSEAAKAYTNGKEGFDKALHEDMGVLLRAGADPILLEMILDKITATD